MSIHTLEIHFSASHGYMGPPTYCKGAHTPSEERLVLAQAYNHCYNGKRAWFIYQCEQQLN